MKNRSACGDTSIYIEKKLFKDLRNHELSTYTENVETYKNISISSLQLFLAIESFERL
jgi:hypothetical protein